MTTPIKRPTLGLAPKLIILFSFLALITGVMVGVAMYQSSHDTLREYILGNNRAAAGFAARFAANYMNGAMKSLSQLAARPLLNRAILEDDLAGMEPHLVQFMDDDRFDNVAVYGTDGLGWVSGLGNKWQNLGGSVADREWFQTAMAEKKPYLGIPVLSRGTGHPVISFIIPIFNNIGGMHAMVVGGISLTELTDALAESQASKTAQISLVDMRQGGMFVANPDTRLILTPVKAQNRAEKRAMAGESGTEDIVKNGESDLAAFAQVKGLPWSIMIVELGETAYASLDRLFIQAVAYIALCILIAIVLGLFLSRTIIRPVRDLVMGTGEIGKGNLEYRIKVTGNDELGQLSQAFNTMAEDLLNVTASRDDLDREMTQRKLAEQRLNKSLEDTERSNKELEQFAYVASHDLQEPLRMVSSYTQLLAKRYEGQLDQDAQDFIHYAVDGANRMQRLIQDLLMYSRITSRGGTFTEVDLHMALGEAVVNLQTAIGESVAIISNGDLPTVMADRTQMVQVFQNLIGNAVKFRRADAPPCVHVTAEPSGSEWTISVRDNGIGIDPQYFKRLFVIFQRLHGKQEYPGTGIGLALCQRIVMRHGGRIWVESVPGAGTTFRFTLGTIPDGNEKIGAAT